MEDEAIRHNFERGPPKDQPAKHSEIWFIGFGGEKLNVKDYDIQGHRMMDRGCQVIAKEHMVFGQVS
jgi:hypothetical protein